MCRSVDLGCHIKEGFHQAVENGFSVAARLLGEAAKEGLHSLATFWIDVDSPTLATGSGDRWTNTETVSFLQEHVLTVSAAIFTLAILVAGVRIAWEQRARPLQQLLKATMIFILVSTAGTATLQLLASWSDEFALDLVQESLPQNQSFDTAVGEVILHGVMTNYAALGMPLSTALWISLAVFAASVIQVILLLIRSAMLVLLAGTFPLAAAATNTEIGKNWFRKYCGWALAFIAYKPAAALIYAAAFRMSQQSTGAQGDDTLVQVLTGVMMLLLAIVALPALLRFAVPITAAVAGGHVGTGSSSADPGNLASGAVNVARARLSGGTPGGGTGGGPSGSSASGGQASGAIGAAAGASLAAAGGAVTAARKSSGSLAGAASHSAGEPGGGTPTPSNSTGPRSSGAAGPIPHRHPHHHTPDPAPDTPPPPPEPPPPSGST